MATELVLEVTPDTLHQIQLRSVRWQPERSHPLVMGQPPPLGDLALVIADVVQDHHHRSIGEGGHQVIKEGDEGFPVLAPTDLPDDLPRSVVQRPEDRALPILPRRVLQPAPSSLPHLCQPGVAVNLALIEVDQTKVAGGVSAFFRSQANTSVVAATAS